MKTRIYTLVVVFLFITQIPVYGRSVLPDTLTPGSRVTVIPGPEYAAGWLHQVFFGAHWRSLWISSIEVEVLDLNVFAGGLTAIKRGGGFQTKSLHFKGNDGKYYKFRSIDKDPEKVLPQEFRDTFVADIVQDQISTSHPLSALIAAPLLTSAGVLNTTPIIVILPDDARLGEFRNDFKEILGTFAENPQDETEDELIFAGADKVVKLYKILEELDDDNDDQVDALAYLKARLMDIFLGDWDRHVGQWKWARFEENGRKTWLPIPRDRDQAFSKYDGFFPWISTYAVPQIEGFSDSYPQINDLTWSGRHLDRRFLSSIDKPAWDSITVFLQARLSDEAITRAVHNMPQQWVEKEGPYLINTLKKRRDLLKNISEEYYEYMARYVSVYGSDKREYAEIKRFEDQTVLVNLYKKDKTTGLKKGKPFFSRRFNSDITDEIRLDLLGGDDTALISGETDHKMIVRVVGGPGKDDLIDSSRVYGYFLGFSPLRFNRHSTYFYDHGSKTEFVTGPSTVVDKSEPASPKPYEEGDNINEKYEPQIEDRDYDWKPGLRFNYNSNDGFALGGGPILIRHDFRKIPYLYRISLLGAYVTNLDAFIVDFDGNFITADNRYLKILMRQAAGYSNFFGYGNESDFDTQHSESDIYRVRFNIFELQTNYVFSPVESLQYWFGFSLNDGETTCKSGSFPDSLKLSNMDKRTYYGLHFGLTLDYRDHVLTPFRGFYLKLDSYNYPRLFNRQDWYHKLQLDARKYFHSEFITSSTLGLRFNIEKLWGDYPLHESAFLGGQKNLRGYIRERFAGDALIYGGAELRCTLFPVKILFPAQFGFSALLETGRVYYQGENSKQWHPVYGGGFWVSFLKRLITINTTLARSDTDLQFYITTGFMF